MSSSDYAVGQENDRVVTSFDGYTSYLLVVDEHSRHVWVFLCVLKDPPIKEMSRFLKIYGLETGGVIRCNQGGELARSAKFITEMEERHGYVVEPTGSDTPTQNGGAES